MADTSKADLKKEIQLILKDADLETTSAKKVRLELQEKLDCDFTERKKEVDQLVMEVINEQEAESEEESEEEEEVVEKPKKKAAPKRKKKGSDDDSDDDFKPKKKKKAGGGGGKPNAFTKPIKLSEELADIVGDNEMPRHEVVKRMWAYIKENKLQDPKNKQIIICDEKLSRVIPTKKFKGFGMTKFLKEHMNVDQQDKI